MKKRPTYTKGLEGAQAAVQAATRETVKLIFDRMILTLEHEIEVSAVVARAASVRALEKQLDAPAGGCWLDAHGGAKKKAAQAQAEAVALQARVEKLGDVTVGPRLLKKGDALIEDLSTAAAVHTSMAAAPSAAAPSAAAPSGTVPSAAAPSAAPSAPAVLSAAAPSAAAPSAATLAAAPSAAMLSAAAPFVAAPSAAAPSAAAPSAAALSATAHSAASSAAPAATASADDTHAAEAANEAPSTSPQGDACNRTLRRRCHCRHSSSALLPLPPQASSYRCSSRTTSA